MSLHPENPSPDMTCTQFEECFDGYVDETLDIGGMQAARHHIACCQSCGREVTRWQQTRILLSTAVADFASAVDLSSLRGDVLSALGMDSKAEATARSAGARLAVRHRGSDQRRPSDFSSRASSKTESVVRGVSRSDRSRERQGDASTPRRVWAAAWRFGSAATVSAAVAAAAVLVLTPAPTPTANTSVLARASVSRPALDSGFRASNFFSGPLVSYTDAAPASYTPPPLAEPKISRVDGLEAAPGRTVSTWVQPGTNARVIWVQDRGMGAPVRTAGLDR